MKDITIDNYPWGYDYDCNNHDEFRLHELYERLVFCNTVKKTLKDLNCKRNLIKIDKEIDDIINEINFIKGE